MQVVLKDVLSGNNHDAQIIVAQKQDIPYKKDGWQFTWRRLYRVEGALFYKITIQATPEIVEGMLMLTLINGEMLYLNNIEVAPHNFGSEGRYEHVAGSLLAFGCYKSFELGRKHYLGFLSFDSKTELIELYEKKYGATHAVGQKMFFDPNAGKALIQKYLKIELSTYHNEAKNSN